MAIQQQQDRRWSTLAITCLAMMTIDIDLTVLHLAVPELTAHLNPTSTQVLWIADIYGFAMGGLLIAMGNLGDRIGRKKLLLAGSAAFGVASVLTAYAPTPELLIAARALLGVAGAAVMPTCTSIVRNTFTDPRQRSQAVGALAGVAAASFAVGPIVGGVLLQYFWWGSVFVINVPIVAVILIVGMKVVPESRNPNPGRIDLLSVALSAIGITTAIYALKEGVHSGLTLDVGIATVAGVATLGTFWHRQTKLAEPLIDVTLFRNRAFSGSVGSNVVAVFTMSAFSLIFAQYFQLVLGWGPLQAGLASVPGALTATAAGVLTATLVQKLGRATLVSIGLVLAAAGFAMFTLTGTETSYLVLVGPLVIFSLGTGFIFTVTGDTILGTVPKERAGAAGAISAVAYQVGGALGIAVLGTLLNGVYRANLPAEANEAARESIATAPQQVLDAAKAAYVQGIHVTVVVCALTLAGLALVTRRALRDVPKVIDE